MKFLQKLGKALMLPVAVLPICGSTADLWYPYGYRILVMSGNHAGWRHSWRSQSDRSVSG